LTPHGGEDEKEPRDDEGACRAGREGHPACDAQAAFVVTGFAGAVLRFFIIFNSNWGQDEPQTLRYAIRLNSSMGADGGQSF